MTGEKPYILIQAKSRDANYRIGKLHKIVNDGSKKIVHFDGNSYSFSFIEVFGVEFPVFHRRLQPLGYEINSLDGIVEGLENIISFLESRPEYRGHTDLLKKIAEAQKQR